jgi:hypothetical protein
VIQLHRILRLLLRRRHVDMRKRLQLPPYPLLDTPQRQAHRSTQPLRRQQALWQIVDRAELQRPHGRELVAVLGQRNHRWKCRPAAQLPQLLEPTSLRVLGARPERSREQQNVAITTRIDLAPALETRLVEHRHARIRTEHAQMVTEPLPIPGVIIDHQQPGWGACAFDCHFCNAKRTRTRARWLMGWPFRKMGR